MGLTSYLVTKVRVGERMEGWTDEVVKECNPMELLLLSWSF
jgi:hypothetical protein